MAKCPYYKRAVSSGLSEKNVTDSYFIDITTKADIFIRGNAFLVLRLLRPITIVWNQNYLFKVLLLKHDIGMQDFTLHGLLWSVAIQPGRLSIRENIKKIIRRFC